MNSRTWYGVFVIAIFTETCVCEYWPCDSDDSVEQAEDNMLGCMGSWKGLDPDLKHSAFLVDRTITEPVCREGMLSGIDKCVTQKVDQNCDNVVTFWKSVKSRYDYICSTRKVFDDFFECRTKVAVTTGVDQCSSDHQQRVRQKTHTHCRSMGVLTTCLSRVFSTECDDNAKQYFDIVFDHELAILREYVCPPEHAFHGVARFVTPVDFREVSETTTKTKVTTSTHARIQDDKMDRSHEKSSVFTINVKYIDDDRDVSSAFDDETFEPFTSSASQRRHDVTTLLVVIMCVYVCS